MVERSAFIFNFTLISLVFGAVLLSASVPFWNWHPDEATYIQIALESRAHGAWLDATYVGSQNFFKPTLLYAAMRASFFAFGDSLLAARLPSLLCLALCVLLVHSWATRLKGPRAGLVAAKVVLMSPLSLRFGHLAMMDVPLALCFLVAAHSGWHATRSSDQFRHCVLLALAAAGAELQKGPAVLPLVMAAFFVEAGLHAMKWRWVGSLLFGVTLGSTWLVASYLRHGAIFISSFFGRENFGKFSAPWSLTHVLLLIAGVLLCALPYRVWPVGFFGRDTAALPRFAKYFPLVALAFYSIPSVTFLQYMICVLPAVALGVGVLASHIGRAVVVTHAVIAIAAIALGAAVSNHVILRPEIACQHIDVVDEKPGMFWLLLQRSDAATAHCVLRRGACLGDGWPVTVPTARPTMTNLIAAMRSSRVDSLKDQYCLSTLD